MKFTREER